MLQRGGLRLRHGGGVEGRVDGPVEHHRPHVGRVPVGVHGAEQGAVREAEEGQPLVAEGAAELLDVAHHVDGAHVVEHRPGRDAAGRRIGPVRGHECVDPRPVDWYGSFDVTLGDGHVNPLLVPTPRIHLDDVEARADGRTEDAEVAVQQACARLTGAAGVDHERADAPARVGRRAAPQRDPDRATGRP